MKLDEKYYLFSNLYLEKIKVKNYYIEKAIIKSEIVEIGGKRFEKELEVFDSIDKKCNKYFIGTTYINLLNSANKIGKILKKYYDIINEFNPKIDKIYIEDTYIDNYSENDVYIRMIDTILKKFEEELIDVIEDIPLKIIISSEFKKFSLIYHSLIGTNNNKNRIDFIVRDTEGMSELELNIKNYLENIADKTKSKSEWFYGIKEEKIISIFLNVLNDKLNFIVKNAEKDITNYPDECQKDMCKIDDLMGLFYFSKYHLNSKNTKIKRCKMCNNYFITKNKSSEKYCKRIYKKTKRTCSEIASNNYRNNPNIKEKEKDIRTINNRIESRLRKRDKQNKTTELENFKNKKKQEFNKINNRYKKTNTQSNKKLEWLKKVDKQLLGNRK